MDPTPIQLQVHPAERGKRRGVVLAGNGCCCCCCLHSVGGFIGAVMATALVEHQAGMERETARSEEAVEDPHPRGDRMVSEGITDRHGEVKRPEAEPVTSSLPIRLPQDSPAVPDIRNPSGRSGAGLYWLAVVCLAPFGALLSGWGLSGSSMWGRSTLVDGLLLVLIYFPAVQLAASVVSLILVQLLPPHKRPASRRAIGKITAGAILGAGVGALGCWLGAH